jgi:hypothetical protein
MAPTSISTQMVANFSTLGILKDENYISLGEERGLIPLQSGRGVLGTSSEE